MGSRLTGHVEPAGGRDRWRLIVNLPPVVVDGRRRYPKAQETVVASGKRAATALLGDWLSELEARSCQDPRRLLFGELCRRWLEDVRSTVRPTTHEFYSDGVRLHIGPALGALPVAEITPAVLRRFYAEKRTVLAESSVHHMHAIIRAAFSWAEDAELVDRNPAARMKRAPKASSEERSTWTEEQIVAAIAAAEGLLVYVPLVLAGWAGLRRGEVCALRWSEVDLEAGLLRVVASLEQTREGMFREAPKSGTARVVPLPAPALEILRRHHTAQEERRLAGGGAWNREGNVIVERRGGPLQPYTLSTSWRWFVRSRGLEPRITFHDLRHSYATGLFDAGGERVLKLVQARLGHASAATTTDIYLHRTSLAEAESLLLHEERIAAAQESLQVSRPVRGEVVELDERRDEKRR